jgi:hypothetical protein
MEETLRDAMKREEWLAANNEKLNYSGEMYSVDVSQQQQQQQQQQHHQQLHHPKQNGIHQVGDYYKDIYSVQSPTFDGEQGDYSSFSAIIGQEQNVDTGEIWDKRKETTSFEHEQPHSSSTVPGSVTMNS